MPIIITTQALRMIWAIIAVVMVGVLWALPGSAQTCTVDAAAIDARLQRASLLFLVSGNHHI